MGNPALNDCELEVTEFDKTLEVVKLSFKSENNNVNNKENDKVYCYCSLKDLLYENYLNNNFDLTKITVLNLNNCDITQVPSCVRSLKLTHLGLSKNKLIEVPNCLYTGLDSLESLDLSDNSIKTFDVEPNCCLNLKYLKLNNNFIYNLPQWILAFRCPNLLEINYNNNRLLKLNCLSESFNYKIIKLEMKNCRSRDIDFKFFKNIKTLEYLDLSNDQNILGGPSNKFLDIDQLFIHFKWNNLKIFKLNNISMSIFPEGLLWLESLTELYLANCDLSWLPQGIDYLTNLEILDISSNYMTSLPTQLTFLESLKILNASHNQIVSLPSVFNKKLQVFDFYDNFLEDFLCDISQFNYIDLEQNYLNTKSFDFFSLYQTNKDLYRLTIIDEERFDGVRKVTSNIYDYDRDSSSSESSDYSDANDDNQQVYDLDKNEENWDTIPPVIIKNKTNNPLITPSDDEWEGEMEVPKPRVKKKTVKVYREDWMFCDVDEK